MRESEKHESGDLEALSAYREAVEGIAGPRFAKDLLNLEGTEAESSNRRRAERARARRLEADAARAEGENELREMLGKWALMFVGFQLAACDAVMAGYVIYSAFQGISIPTEVMIGWMTASLVEIIGILWVIARSLFPFRDISRDEISEKHRN